MTCDDIRRRVAHIAASAQDPEAAHALEDELHQDVLRYIADTSPTYDAPALARAALETVPLDFPRWCA